MCAQGKEILKFHCILFEKKVFKDLNQCTCQSSMWFWAFWRFCKYQSWCDPLNPFWTTLALEHWCIIMKRDIRLSALSDPSLLPDFNNLLKHQDQDRNLKIIVCIFVLSKSLKHFGESALFKAQKHISLSLQGCLQYFTFTQKSRLLNHE